MVHFEIVRWRNLLSTGQMMTEVQLDRSPSTVVTGKNGGGKSSILDAITFALFGKPFRKINKGQLVNTKNGRDLLCEIEFTVGDSHYKVRRGIKPDIFEVIKNGYIQNQSSESRDYQKILNSIIGFDYQTFVQLVIIGKTQYTSFMKLDSGRRRLFVETLLNLLVFSGMNKLHTSNLSAHRDKIVDIKAAISVASEKVQLRKKYITELVGLLTNARNSALSSEEAFNKKRADLLAEIELLEWKKTECEPPIIDVDAAALAVDTLRDLSVKFELKLTDMRSKYKFFSSGTTCHTCGSVISEETKHSTCVDLSQSIVQCELALKSVTKKLAAAKAELVEAKKSVHTHDAWKKNLADIDKDITNARHNLANLSITQSSDIQDLEAKVNEEENRLKKLEDIYFQLCDKLTELTNKTEYYNIASTMLKDGGIKSMVISRYISIINHTINTNLAKLGFFAKFTLDENFNETIQARGIDTLSYDNFSEGEKLRIDMAILLAWRDIAQMQSNASTNLMMFDEIFDASLDQYGIDALVALLKELSKTNVFIITHSPDKLSDAVRSQIQFQKVDGFSKLVA